MKTNIDTQGRVYIKKECKTEFPRKGDIMIDGREVSISTTSDGRSFIRGLKGYIEIGQEFEIVRKKDSEYYINVQKNNRKTTIDLETKPVETIMKETPIKLGSYEMYIIEKKGFSKKDCERYFQNPQYPEIIFSALYILLNDYQKKCYIGYTSNPTERLSTHKSKPEFVWYKALVFVINGNTYEEHLDSTDAQYLECLSLRCVKSATNKKGADRVYIRSEEKKNMKKFFREFVYPTTKKYAPYVFKENESKVDEIIETT